MKILITVMMMAAMTSAFAGDCKLGGECKDKAACDELKGTYSSELGKCVNPTASETDTQCERIVNSGGSKAAPGATGADASKEAAGAPK